MGRRLVPSLSDFLFASLLVWLFVAGSGWMALLADGDTGWHIRSGEFILSTGTVPVRDLFSFSKPGAPWFAWEWLSDVLFAFLYRHWGLAGVVALAGIVICLTVLIVFRQMLWRGASALPALVVTLLAAGACSIHFLARPHIFTLLLLTVSLWILERDRRQRTWLVWLLVPLMALWVNLHGGFLALLCSIGLVAVGSGVKMLPRYTVLFAASAAASLVNPYGIRLHAHIFHYLRSGWIREAVDEFQSPRFRSENLLQFEILLIAGLLLAGALLSKRRVADALPVVFWGHLALVSVRHVPVFAVACAPLVAVEASALWERWTRNSPPGSIPGILGAVSRDAGRGFLRITPWAAVFAAAALWLTPWSKWPPDFPESKFPVAMIGAHPELLSGFRVFTSDQWGDYLIYRGWPRQRVFIDGRSDFYGREVASEYLRLAEARPGWDRILKTHGFQAALLAPDSPLASLLERDPGWRAAGRDARAVLFERVPTSAAAPPNETARLRR